jgi:hypothetical protein
MLWREILLQRFGLSGDEGDEHKWVIPSAVSADSHKEFTVRQIIEHFGFFASDAVLEERSRPSLHNVQPWPLSEKDSGVQIWRYWVRVRGLGEAGLRAIELWVEGLASGIGVWPKHRRSGDPGLWVRNKEQWADRRVMTANTRVRGPRRVSRSEQHQEDVIL